MITQIKRENAFYMLLDQNLYNRLQTKKRFSAWLKDCLNSLPFSAIVTFNVKVNAGKKGAEAKALYWIESGSIVDSHIII